LQDNGADPFPSFRTHSFIHQREVQTGSVRRLLSGWCACLFLFFAGAATTAFAASLELVWTAPGNDADTGQAYGYDLRYSTNAVPADTVAWWAGATLVTSLPHPSPSGQEDTKIVTGLQPETTYSFLIRCYDEVGNLSGFSNVTVATTPAEIPGPNPGCISPSSAPSQFSASEDSGAVLLTWAPATDPAATRLHIWRAYPTRINATILTTIADMGQTQYRDTSVQPGETYRYRVTWADSCGNGPASANLFVTLAPKAAPPAEPDGSTVHAYPNPSTEFVHFLIHVDGGSEQRVHLRLYDPMGHVVGNIAEGTFPSGDTVITWPRVTYLGDRVAAGYYESIGFIGVNRVRERIILLP